MRGQYFKQHIQQRNSKETCNVYLTIKNRDDSRKILSGKKLIFSFVFKLFFPLLSWSSCTTSSSGEDVSSLDSFLRHKPREEQINCLWTNDGQRKFLSKTREKEILLWNPSGRRWKKNKRNSGWIYTDFLFLFSLLPVLSFLSFFSIHVSHN